MGLNSSKLARPRMEGWGGVHIQETFVLHLRGVGERGGAGGTGNTLRVEQTIAYSPWSSLAGEIGPWAVGQAWARIITITAPPRPPDRPPATPAWPQDEQVCSRLLLPHPPCGLLPRGLTGSGPELSSTPGTAPSSASDTPVLVPHPHQACWLLASCSDG